MTETLPLSQVRRVCSPTNSKVKFTSREPWDLSALALARHHILVSRMRNYTPHFLLVTQSEKTDGGVMCMCAAGRASWGLTLTRPTSTSWDGELDMLRRRRGHWPTNHDNSDRRRGIDRWKAGGRRKSSERWVVMLRPQTLALDRLGGEGYAEEYGSFCVAKHVSVSIVPNSLNCQKTNEKMLNIGSQICCPIPTPFSFEYRSWVK